MGSNPVGVTTWAISSAGRAPALQAGCQQFDPVIAHQTLFKELEHEGLHHRARFLLILVCSMEFVEDGFKFKNLHYKLQT